MSASFDPAPGGCATPPPGAPASGLAVRYDAVRTATRALTEPLELEDYGLQSMPDASPAKWHLAHTTWFFETFVLARHAASRGLEHRPFHPRFGYLFNSYYETVGRFHPRPQRGLLSRPTVAQVQEYRDHVDLAMTELLARGVSDEMAAVIEVGLQHEQQHQELVLTDLKHGLGCNPLRPIYRAAAPAAAQGSDHPSALPQQWLEHEGGLVDVGHTGLGFGFDNELPRHRVYLRPFAIASRLVTCGDYLEFMADGGYERAELWLSAGWDVVQRLGWEAPLYWERESASDPWQLFTLHGLQAIDAAEPVCHVSLYEADAFARWRDSRLPTEAEWELTCGAQPIAGNFAESRAFHPRALVPSTSPARLGLEQAFGDVWSWTASAYSPYPGFRPLPGALGEYNGKFMCNQLVLRGGSCATPASHMRASYRNFFPPEARWQFSGLRLARDP